MAGLARVVLRAGLLTGLLVRASPAGTRILRGEVVGVADGDTLTVRTGANRHTRIRLTGIDAPEKDQPWGASARKALTRKVLAQEVLVEFDHRDRYGRALGRVYLGDRLVNTEMVQEGLAWHYERYARSPELAGLETAARESRLGLWKREAPTPPWTWRRTHPR